MAEDGRLHPANLSNMTRLVLSLFLAGIASALPLVAQTADARTRSDTEPPPLVEYTFTLDAFSATKMPGDGSNMNALRNFDVKSNQFDLDAAALAVQVTKGPLGFHFDSGYGQMFKTMSSLDPWGGANRYFGQAYVSVKPFSQSDFDLDFGKFYTSVGAEVPDTASNFQYSRSLLFTLGAPYYHFGLRSSVSVTKSLVVGAQIMNGWNDVVNNTGGHSLGLTSTLTKRYFNWTETYLTGPEPLFVPNPQFPTLTRRCQLVDSVLRLTLTPTLNGYVEVLYGGQSRLNHGHDQWYGVAGAVSIPLKAGWSVSPRWGFYNDAAGATSGQMQKLQEWTGTLQYQLKKFPLITRGEYRYDFSDHDFFAGNGSRPPAKSQQTALVGMVYTFKGKI